MVTEVPTDWYTRIEKPIRPIVKLLRDSGHNTFCSCGHDMTVDIELGNSVAQVEEIATLLVEHGHSNFRIDTWLGVPSDGFWVRRATVRFGGWGVHRRKGLKMFPDACEDRNILEAVVCEEENGVFGLYFSLRDGGMESFFTEDELREALEQIEASRGGR